MLDNIIHIIDYFGLNHKKTGEFIYYIHFIIPIIVVLILIFCNNKFLILIIALSVLIQNIFYLWDRGCIISRLERILIGEDKVIIDPILKISGVKTTGNNRHLLMFIIMLIIWSFIIYKIS